MARDRTGSDPDRFLPRMREAGLRVDGDHDEFRDPALALLDMLTLALGIRLPRDIAVGVLPAVDLTDK
jgi:hypothetical protein